MDFEMAVRNNYSTESHKICLVSRTYSLRTAKFRMLAYVYIFKSLISARDY